MNWEYKVAMCNTINNGDTAGFRKIVLDNIEKFDIQAWDMFSQAELKSDPESIEFYKKIFPYLHKCRESIYSGLRLREKLRLSAIESIIDGLLTEKNLK